MKKTLPRKLALHRLTVRNLSSVAGGRARNGDGTVGTPCSFSCQDNTHCCPTYDGGFSCDDHCA